MKFQPDPHILIKTPHGDLKLAELLNVGIYVNRFILILIHSTELKIHLKIGNEIP